MVSREDKMSSVDEVELGALLRGRRKRAGRTIASVAVDAGLSVPYIANLENGRGNPTMAALQRLSTALGARLDVALSDVDPVAAPVENEAVRRLLAESGRATAVIGRSAAGQGVDRRVVADRLTAVLVALGHVLGTEPTGRDLDRLLDLLLLSTADDA